MMSFVQILNLYKFVKIQNVKQTKAQLKALCEQHSLKGSILLSEEGVNAMLAGTHAAIQAFIADFEAYPEFTGIDYKFSETDAMPFHRLKVMIKPEIVTFGVEGISPTVKVGEYVEPEGWNALLQDPDVVLIDTRNDYEVEIGTFKNAINPKTDTFREFPTKYLEHLDPSVHKKVAMFCTGGIRCEKASAFLLNEGFENVYHLKGGILKYLETVPEAESLWEGECFVFDHRVAVDHSLQPGKYCLCFGCKSPLTEADKTDALYEAEVQCPHCADSVTETQLQSRRERKKQMALARAKNQVHLGAQYSQA